MCVLSLIEDADSGVFTHRKAAVLTNYYMVHKVNVQLFKHLIYPACKADILFRGSRRSLWVIMTERCHCTAAVEDTFGNCADIHICRAGRAFCHSFYFCESEVIIEAGNTEFLIGAAYERASEKLFELIGVIIDNSLGLSAEIDSCGSGDHLKKYGGIFGDALNLTQFGDIRIENLSNGAESVYQSMSDKVCIGTGNGIEKQHFDYLVRAEAIEARLNESLPHTFPMTLMGIFCGDLLRIFGIFFHVAALPKQMFLLLYHKKF